MSARSLPDDIRAIVFDVGETLVDETRLWTRTAHACGIPPFTLMGVIGGLIARGEDHSAVWSLLGIERPEVPASITVADPYSDALPCLRAARTAGFVVGIAGNQPSGTIACLRDLGIVADFVASSAAWKVAKPDAVFFDRVRRAAQCTPNEILYVGDRLDNDVRPAHAAGMRTALIRRGPWAYLQSARGKLDGVDLQLNSLDELTVMMS